MYMLDALGREKRITIHCHHHEQDAGIAAEAYARISRKTGVCFATSGPGGPNLVEAITECWLDSVPVVFFIAQNSTNQSSYLSGIKGLRQHGPFDMNIIPIVESITKKVFCITDPAEADDMIGEAFLHACMDRPGPVVVVVPTDVQRMRIVAPYVAVGAVVKALRQAKHPLFLLGQGVRFPEHCTAIAEYAEAHYIPIVTTQAAKDLFDNNDCLFMGHVGIKGDRGANKIVQKADCIICLGTSLNMFTTGYRRNAFAPDAQIFHADVDAAVLEKNEDLLGYVPIHMSVCAFLEALRELHYDEKLRNKIWCEREVIEEEYEDEMFRVNIYNTIKAINKMSDANDIIVSDAGSSFYAVGQAWENKLGQRFISSNGLGSMGWALPAALGAWNASKRRVLCFTGDGSFMTGITVLPQISHEFANIKIFIFNNEGYVSIRNTQDSFFEERHVGTDSSNGVYIPSNLQELIESYEIRYVDINFYEELIAYLSEILSYEGPMVIDIHTNINQKIEPTVANIIGADGSISSSTLDDMEPRR